jgi:signal transduction histidine kinase
LPAAIGIEDKEKNKFIGYLSAGISIEKLTTRLLQSSMDEISFVIFDDDMNLITSSEPTINESNFPMSDSLRRLIADNTDRDVNEFFRPVSSGQYIYTHYTRSQKYPFTILVGQNKHFYYQELKEELLPKVIMYISLGVIFTSILLFLGYQVIKPIIELGHAADNISKGKAVTIPTYKAYELGTLSSQLENIADITKNLRIKQIALGKANQDLEQANSFIKSNMSFLSHELINPISSITGFAQLLSKKVEKYKDNELKDFVDIVLKTSVHQNKQLNYFLKLFKFQESDKYHEDKELDMKELIQWNVSMINHHAKKQEVEIKIEVEPNLKIVGDEMMIGQLIQNLASNAAKYNKKGGTLKVSAFTNSKGCIVLNFADTGIGIPKKDLEKIFKKFTRLKTKESNKTIGYGIGLAYAKECALAHGANITVKSTVGKGTTFTVTFPSFRTVEV